MQAIYRAYERNTALILANERWADGYSKSPETHAKLIKASARLERKLVVFYRDMSKKADTFIYWYAYNQALNEVKTSRVNAYDVSVIVNDKSIDQAYDTFITIVFQDIALATALGAQSGEAVYKVPLGITVTDADIQRIAMQQVAHLVGKKVTKDGQVIDNPKPDYVVSDKTRADIRQSIQTSLNMGEDVQHATARLKSTIKSAVRAALIAETETVNAYNSGIVDFGHKSNAIGKQWTDNGAVDICATNTGDGVIPINENFSSGNGQPTAHPRCRCSMRLVYQNELDNNPNLFD